MKDFKRRVKKIQLNLKKFMMANSLRTEEEGQGIGFLRFRGRPQPSAPPLDLLEADDNHNEINANYLPSMEPRPGQNAAQPGGQSLGNNQNVGANQTPQDVRERLYFDTDTGFYESSDEVSSRSNEGAEDVPNTFTEAAQNDYNSEVERIMQESRQLQAGRILAHRQQTGSSQQQNNVNREQFPVEVDLVGVEASTSLFLLGFVLVFVSRWYALIYLAVVSFLLYCIRRNVRADQRARVQAAAELRLPMPQIFTDLKEAIMLIIHSLAVVMLVPILILGAISFLGRLSQRRPTPVPPAASPDCKFLVQLMFFPLFLPYWMSKFSANRPRAQPTVQGRGGGGGNMAALRAVTRFLGAGRR